VDSSATLGPATALDGAPPIAGIVGDQQASLFGQGCTLPGMAKATFGTGGMLDCCVGSQRPAFPARGPSGTIPIVAWKRDKHLTWGVEALMLSAGSCVEWLRDDLGIISDVAQSDDLAGAGAPDADVWFVPALMGIGTPLWDFGARGTLIGLTRGTGRAEVVRAVLDGIAHRGADLLEAAEADTGLEVSSLRVDGGMCANATFVQSLADAIGRPVEVAPLTEATTLGAAYLAGIATGVWSGEEEVSSLWSPSRVLEPARTEADRQARRARWLQARERSLRTIPELSALDF
jgi:glycerol kinase